MNRNDDIMDELSTISINNTISKASVDEEMSMLRAAMEDAASRLTEGIRPETISNEKIQKDDEILDTYRVASDAIHGGMGSVWRVHHKKWNIDLAMKRPQPGFFAEGSKRKKEGFVAECENWINLGLHPGIVACYYVRDIGGVPSIFSEWMDNGSLKDRIRDESLYKGTEEEVQRRLLDIAVQTARGLQYSHKNGLVHQDVKPGNILLTKEWDAKVADFGLSKAQEQLIVSDTDAAHMAASGGYTPAYCSMEQMLGEMVTPQTDIYSWALSILEMYSGRRLWKKGAEAGRDCLMYFAECKIPLPEEMQELIKNCLETDLNDRPHDFDQILDDLLEIYHSAIGEAYPRTEPEAASDSADSLNNRALSFLDLDKPEQADKIWKVLEKTGHSESIYNYLLSQIEQERIHFSHASEYMINTMKNNPDAATAALTAKMCAYAGEDSLNYYFNQVLTEEIKSYAEDVIADSVKNSDSSDCRKIGFGFEDSSQVSEAYFDPAGRYAVLFSEDTDSICLYDLLDSDRGKNLKKQIRLLPDNNCEHSFLNPEAEGYTTQKSGSKILRIQMDKLCNYVLISFRDGLCIYDIGNVDPSREAKPVFSSKSRHGAFAGDYLYIISPQDRWNITIEKYELYPEINNTGENHTIHFVHEDAMAIKEISINDAGNLLLISRDGNRILYVYEIATGKLLKTVYFSRDGINYEFSHVQFFVDDDLKYLICKFNNHFYLYDPDRTHRVRSRLFKNNLNKGDHLCLLKGGDSPVFLIWDNDINQGETFTLPSFENHFEYEVSRVQRTEKILDDQSRNNRYLKKILALLDSNNKREAFDLWKEASSFPHFDETEGYDLVMDRLDRFCVRKSRVKRWTEEFIPGESGERLVCSCDRVSYFYSREETRGIYKNEKYFLTARDADTGKYIWSVSGRGYMYEGKPDEISICAAQKRLALRMYKVSKDRSADICVLLIDAIDGKELSRITGIPDHRFSHMYIHPNGENVFLDYGTNSCLLLHFNSRRKISRIKKDHPVWIAFERLRKNGRSEEIVSYEFDRNNGKIIRCRTNYDYDYPAFTGWDQKSAQIIEDANTLFPEDEEACFSFLTEKLRDNEYGFISPDIVREKLREVRGRNNHFDPIRKFMLGI